MGSMGREAACWGGDEDTDSKRRREDLSGEKRRGRKRRVRKMRKNVC